MASPPSVDYRTSARPDLFFDLGKKPGPAVARRRVALGYFLAFGVLVGVLGTVAARTPDSTTELIASSPLFSAVYTFSVLGLVGFVTLVVLRLTLLRGAPPTLRVGPEDLVLTRPEGSLLAPVRAIHSESIVVPKGEREHEHDALDLRFPDGQRVRIVCAAQTARTEHADPWDYSLEEEEFVELRRRLGRT